MSTTSGEDQLHFREEAGVIAVYLSHEFDDRSLFGGCRRIRVDAGQHSYRLFLTSRSPITLHAGRKLVAYRPLAVLKERAAGDVILLGRECTASAEAAVRMILQESQFSGPFFTHSSKNTSMNGTPAATPLFALSREERFVKDVLEDKGARVDPVPRSDDRTPDFDVQIEDTRYIIEVKTREEDEARVDARHKTLECGKVHGDSEELKRKNTISGIVNGA